MPGCGLYLPGAELLGSCMHACMLGNMHACIDRRASKEVHPGQRWINVVNREPGTWNPLRPKKRLYMLAQWTPIDAAPRLGDTEAIYSALAPSL